MGKVDVQQARIRAGEVENPAAQFPAVNLPWLVAQGTMDEAAQPAGARLGQHRDAADVVGKVELVLAVVREDVVRDLLQTGDLPVHMQLIFLEEVGDVAGDNWVFRH